MVLESDSRWILRSSMVGVQFDSVPNLFTAINPFPSVLVSKDSWPERRDQLSGLACDWILQEHVLYDMGAILQIDFGVGQICLSLGISLPALCSGEDTGQYAEIDLDSGWHYFNFDSHLVDNATRRFLYALRNYRENIEALSRISSALEIECCSSRDELYALQLKAIHPIN